MHDEDRGKRQESIHILMAGGGTGGHVYPALAIAAELAERGNLVSWIGRPSSMEETLVRAADVPFHTLEAKPWVGKGLAAKAGAVATLMASSLRARSLVRRLAADVVLGTGGYVSTPALLGARLAGRPVFLLEPNAVAGWANRIASRWCKAAFVAHEDAARLLACETVVSGTPVRRSFHEVDPLPAQDPHLLVLGGSQGAVQINDVMPSVVRRLSSAAGLAGLSITHQTGRADLASVRTAYCDLGMADLGMADLGRVQSPKLESKLELMVEPRVEPTVEIVPFIDDMAAAMAKAQLVVSRAGALAIAELGAAGRPAILIPLTAAGAGHQRFNAERMADSGAAVVLAGEEVTAKNLGDTIAQLLSDRPRLESMALSARSLAKPAAAAEISEALERAARTQRGAA